MFIHCECMHIITPLGTHKSRTSQINYTLQAGRILPFGQYLNLFGPFMQNNKTTTGKSKAFWHKENDWFFLTLQEKHVSNFTFSFLSLKIFLILNTTIDFLKYTVIKCKQGWCRKDFSSKDYSWGNVGSEQDHKAVYCTKRFAVRHAAPCIVSHKTCNRAHWKSRSDLFLTQWHSELESFTNKIGAFKTWSLHLCNSSRKW